MPKQVLKTEKNKGIFFYFFTTINNQNKFFYFICLMEKSIYRGR
jgi:hypothetical protein